MACTGVRQAAEADRYLGGAVLMNPVMNSMMMNPMCNLLMMNPLNPTNRAPAADQDKGDNDLLRDFLQHLFRVSSTISFTLSGSRS